MIRESLLSALALALFAAVHSNAEGAPSLLTDHFDLRSRRGKENPKHFTCDGENVSPPLAWTGAAAGTKAFALIVDDPDAPQRLFHPLDRVQFAGFHPVAGGRSEAGGSGNHPALERSATAVPARPRAGTGHFLPSVCLERRAERSQEPEPEADRRGPERACDRGGDAGWWTYQR